MNMNLTICPTRQRPEKFFDMMMSFLSTSLNSDLLVILDNDDPTLQKYFDIIDKGFKYVQENKLKTLVDVTVNEHRISITAMINQGFMKHQDYDHYQITNDDFIYRTTGWDLSLMSEIALHGRYGIAYATDLLAGSNLCTAPLVSGELVRTLGWLQMPTLIGLFGDSVWMHLGRKLKSIYYREDVVIEHMHYFSGKVPPDKTYEITNSRERYKMDQKAFVEWIEGKSKEDIEKLSKIIYEL